MPGLMAAGKQPNGDAAPTFKYSGVTNLQALLGRGFEKELSAVLVKASFGGQFTLILSDTVKASEHTKGLRIGSPIMPRKAVELTWHGSDNASRVRMLLLAPNTMRPEEFHRRLKKAQQTLLEEEGDESFVEIIPQKDAGAVFLPPTTPNKKSLGTQTPQKAFLPAEQRPQVMPAADDPEAIEIFMMEIIGSATPEGIVSKRACCNAIISLFNRTSGGAIGMTLESFVRRGHLTRVDEYRLMIARQWMSKLRPTLSPTTLDTSASPASNEISNAYQALKEKVAAAPALRAHLEDIRQKRAVLMRQLEDLTAQETVTRQTLDALAEDERKLAIVKQMLGLS